MSRLVVTRKVNDVITLSKGGEHIATIIVGKIDRNQVRLVFEADPSVQIKRDSSPKKSAK